MTVPAVFLQTLNFVDACYIVAFSLFIYGMSGLTLKAVGFCFEYPAPDPENVPRAGPSGPRRRPVRPGRASKIRRTGQQAPGHRLHRRGKLRLVDAASPPGPAAERAADARRDD